ncbi:MAG: hypothetical protein R6V19_13325, partial [Armatimonadota bacterium]
RDFTPAAAQSRFDAPGGDTCRLSAGILRGAGQARVFRKNVRKRQNKSFSCVTNRPKSATGTDDHFSPVVLIESAAVGVHHQARPLCGKGMITPCDVL